MLKDKFIEPKIDNKILNNKKWIGNIDRNIEFYLTKNLDGEIYFNLLYEFKKFDMYWKKLSI